MQAAGYTELTFNLDDYVSAECVFDFNSHTMTEVCTETFTQDPQKVTNFYTYTYNEHGDVLNSSNKWVMSYSEGYENIGYIDETYTYSNGRTSTHTVHDYADWYDSTNTTSYQYDEDGHLISNEFSSSDGRKSTTVIEGTYDEYDRPLSIIYTDGTQDTYSINYSYKDDMHLIYRDYDGYGLIYDDYGLPLDDMFSYR